MKRPRTPPTASGMVEYPGPDHELMKRLRPPQSVEEVCSLLCVYMIVLLLDFYWLYCP